MVSGCSVVYKTRTSAHVIRTWDLPLLWCHLNFLIFLLSFYAFFAQNAYVLVLLSTYFIFEILYRFGT
jgi:hypothetical protein